MKGFLIILFQNLFFLNKSLHAIAFLGYLIHYQWTKFQCHRNQEQKDLLHEQFKNYKNILLNLTKKSMENYYTEYFRRNKNNLMKIWPGIKCDSHKKT